MQGVEVVPGVAQRGGVGDGLLVSAQHQEGEGGSGASI